MKIKPKVLSKILNDKEFDYKEELLDRYHSYLRLKNRRLRPKRKVLTNYIGMEIECFTRLSHEEVTAKILEHDLEKNVAITSDGSIRPTFGSGIELRVLFKQKTLSTDIKKLAVLLNKKTFGVNKSCGLHVHLDMRNRNWKQCYDKLMKFQDVLFGMVKPERWNNYFCKYMHNNTTVSGYSSHGTRHVSINKNAYKQHKTIEVRVHHGTLDVIEIEKWINLLLKVIGPEELPDVKNKNDVLTWAKGNKNLHSYLMKNFNDDWFRTKLRIIKKIQLRQQELLHRINNDGWVRL
jgi:hypothetical protein